MDTQPQELLPPGAPMPRIENAKDQLRRYQADMLDAYYRAFPAYGRGSASRFRSFYGQRDALGYYATPRRPRA